MKVNVLLVGSGIVGFATGDGLERYGNNVTFYDVDDVRRKWLRERNYNVIDDYDQLDSLPDVIFICTREEHVEDALHELTKHTIIPGFVTIRSTMNPGQTEELEKKFGIHLCHNPEFLTEAQSQWDFLNPNKIVVGECCSPHGDLLEKLYKPFQVPLIRVNRKTSEMIKLATNACFSSMISFWNELKQICDRLGVNSTEVGAVVCMDPRISHYGSRFHGRKFSGHCLPKDLNHILDVAKEVGYPAPLLKAVKKVNEMTPQ